MSERVRGKICPLRGSACLGDRCVWFDGGECAVWRIGRMLENIFKYGVGGE